MLRPLEAGDWDALYAVASDPLIWAIHPARDRWKEPVFRAFFEDAIAQGGALAVTLRADGRIIGSSRFQSHDPAHGGEVEIGWTFLARAYWGGSFNAELKRLMLSHALGQVSRVLFRVGEHNLRSRGAMVKIGGRLRPGLEIVPTPLGDVSHVVYEITAADLATGPLA